MTLLYRYLLLRHLLVTARFEGFSSACNIPGDA